MTLRGKPWFPSTSRLLSSCLVALALAGCGLGSAPIGLELRSKTSFELDWQRYTRVRTSKAFAFAGDPLGFSVTGMAYGMPSSADARARALDYCEEQRLARGLLEPCVILALDDTVVDVASSTSPLAALRSGS
jgi:hypothetical protein